MGNIDFSKLGKYSLISTDKIKNAVYIGINDNKDTINVSHLSSYIKNNTLREHDIDCIIFNTNLLKTNKFFTINRVFIIYISDDTYYDAKNNKFNFKYCYDIIGKIFMKCDSIDFKLINEVRVAKIKEIMSFCTLLEKIRNEQLIKKAK